MESSFIGYVVYSEQLNNNGLKNLHAGICIESTALWKNGGVMMCPSLTALHDTEKHHFMVMSVPSTTQRSFYKDVQQLYRTIDSSTDGQAAIESVDDISVRVSLHPKTGNNAHATFYMSSRNSLLSITLYIICSSAYPAKAPTVKFDTPIFHPNIDFLSGDICLSIFTQWRTCYGLLDLVKAILYLIDHPNFESHLSQFVEVTEPAIITTKSALLLAGFPVDGYCFTPNASWCEWAREKNCFPTAEDVREGYIWTPPKEENHEELDILEQKGNDESEDVEETLTESWSDISSDTIPSFAKFRCSIDDDDFCESTPSISQYYPPYVPIELGMHRIVLFQPTSKDSPEQKSTYYYGEVMCNRQHLREIGLNYPEIFKGSLTFDLQVDPETRQRSRLCVWQPYHEDIGSSLNSDSYYEGEYYLSVLFQDPKPPRNLTADFCPWSKEDGLGTHYLLDRLFFDGQRTRGSFTCFLDKDSENGSSNNGIVGLFNSENLNEYECQETICDEDIIEEQSEISSDSQFGDIKDIDDVSQSSVIPHFLPYPSNCKTSMRLCYTCNHFAEIMLDCVNKEMYPDWKWVFLQTRWPLRFAPQQLVELSTVDIFLPPWRVSASRLLHDVCQYCTKNPHLENLVLLDPMSLSPLSPLINLMQRNATQPGKLTGILWMTSYQALSPFFQSILVESEFR
ncbi:hypothetical protein ACTXT7_009416 [Hymenolepis weldensis]